MRLARTEINMAYRYADYERWKDMDFVLGVKIQLSDAHPKYDICDVLQGEYPKNFKFGSWHPHCLCFATPILQSDKDFIAGKQPKPITELPQNFKDWYEFHKDEIQIANEKGKLPYFLKDNFKYNDNGEFVFNGAFKSPLEIAKDVPQTLEDIKKKYGDKLPATLKELNVAIKEYKHANPAFKEREKEINALMKELFNDNDWGLDIDAHLLESVFDKGFLNTFQTGTSKGHLGSTNKQGPINENHLRLYDSHIMFMPSTHKFISRNFSPRYNGKQLERGEYEKYGHLLDKDKYLCYKYNLTHYGNVQVRFKKDKVLCTWTISDSLFCGSVYYQPSLVTDPRVESFNKIPIKPPSKNNSWDSLYKWQQEHRTKYIELQYHGKVTIDDVQSLTFGDSPEKFISKELIKKLQDKGIELWYIKGKEAVKYTTNN